MDEDIGSDVSFESADENVSTDDLKLSAANEVFENVKKKDEDDTQFIPETDQRSSEGQDPGDDLPILQEVDLDNSSEDNKETAIESDKISQRTEIEITKTGEADSESTDHSTGTSIPETEAKTDNTKNTALEENEQIQSKKAESSPANQSIDRTEPTDDLPGSTPGGQGSWGSWGGGWSGWGSSILTSATATVSAVSGSVGKVIGNVESSLGVPRPEDLQTSTEAETDGQKIDCKEEGSTQDSDVQPASSPGAAVGSLFSYGASALTSVVGKTLTGGLDALEVLGKKTMDVLQEGDPGLKKTKAYLRGRKEGPNLSQLLREAKEDADERAKYQEEEEERQKCHFGWLFEQNQGLAHLEALEILSNESETRVETTMGVAEDESTEALKTELMEIKDAFELEDVESEDADESGDFVNTITEHLFGLCIAAKPDKLKLVQTTAHAWLANLDNESEETPDAKEIHQKSMQVLADLTARSIEQFHKTGELLLLKQVTEENKSPIQQATSLSKLTSVLCAEVSFVASKFSEKLSKMAASSPNAETINGYITNIFLEASNSTSYIQDAFQLLLPVMQVVAIDRRESS